MPNIEAHQQDWSDLALFPAGQWVTTDDDIQAWNDILHMRALVDELLDTLDTALTDHTFDALATTAELIEEPSVEFDIDLYLEPWPRDRAADMLTAWRAGTTTVDIENAGIPA